MNKISYIEFANFIIDNRAPELPAKALADIFDRLIWCLDTTVCEELHVARDEWLLGDDSYRAEIALAMNETFPGGKESDVVEFLQAVTDKHPERKKACTEIIQRWEKQCRDTALCEQRVKAKLNKNTK